MRPVIALLASMSVSLLAGSVVATTATGGRDQVMEIAVEPGAPCPSLLGCSQSVRLLHDDGTVEDAGSLFQGEDRIQASTEVAVEAGSLTVELTAGSVTARIQDHDLISSHVRELTRCSLDVIVVGGADPTQVIATIRYGWPSSGQLGASPASAPAWSCELIQPAGRRDGPPPHEAAPVLLDQAIECMTGGPSPETDCGKAIVAARAGRRAFEVAPIALVAADCPDMASCAYPTFAVSFLTREGDAWPWSETLSVSLLPGGPRVTQWPESGPPTAIAGRQAWMAELGDRLGDHVPIPTDEAWPDGTVRVCMTALLEGTVVRHGDWGVAIATDGVPVRVIWPHGWTARVAPEGVVLVDDVGETVAREGQRVQVGGGETADGWSTCEGVEPAF